MFLSTSFLPGLQDLQVHRGCSLPQSQGQPLLHRSLGPWLGRIRHQNLGTGCVQCDWAVTASGACQRKGKELHVLISVCADTSTFLYIFICTYRSKIWVHTYGSNSNLAPHGSFRCLPFVCTSDSNSQIWPNHHLPFMYLFLGQLYRVSELSTCIVENLSARAQCLHVAPSTFCLSDAFVNSLKLVPFPHPFLWDCLVQSLQKHLQKLLPQAASHSAIPPTPNLFLISTHEAPSVLYGSQGLTQAVPGSHGDIRVVSHLTV